MLALRFKAITLRNFISTGAVTQALDLSQNGLTLILGQHTDANGDVSRNGTGKSTILQAISYALYGQALSKIKVDNLVNDINMKNMMVTLDFEVGSNRYRIERGRKPAILKFYVNDAELRKEEANDSKGENADTQEDINEAVGMDHTMFTHILALNTQTIPFLKEKAGPQREIIEKLLGVTQISDRAKILSKKISIGKDEIKGHEATINAQREANSRIKLAGDQTRAKAAAWEQTHATAVREIASLLDALSAIDVDAELLAIERAQSYDSNKKELEAAIQQTRRELDLLEREARAAKAELARLKTAADTLDPDGLLIKAKRTLDNIDYARPTIEKKQKSAEANLRDTESALLKKAEERGNANTSECSTCGQALHGTNHLEKILVRLDAEIARLNVEKTKASEEVEANISALKLLLEERLVAESNLTELEKELEAAREVRRRDYLDAAASASQDSDTTEALSKTLADLNTALSDLGGRPRHSYKTAAEVYQVKQDRAALEAENDRLAKEMNPHLEQVAAFEAAIQEIDYAPLEAAKDLLRHQELLQKLLTNKDSFIRKKIVEQNLYNLNSRLTHYLDALVFPCSVKFMSDLTVEIMKLGRDYDYEQLSRGEGNRLNLAMSLAMRDLWESLNSPTNLLFVDELLDMGLDQTGAESALQLLKSLGRDRSKNVFLISHKEELRGRIDRTLLVNKEEGFTRFELDQF